MTAFFSGINWEDFTVEYRKSRKHELVSMFPMWILFTGKESFRSMSTVQSLWTKNGGYWGLMVPGSGPYSVISLPTIRRHMLRIYASLGEKEEPGKAFGISNGVLASALQNYTFITGKM
jgi:hypothetical protein